MLGFWCFHIFFDSCLPLNCAKNLEVVWWQLCGNWAEQRLGNQRSIRWNLISLKLTAFLHLSIGRKPFPESSIPRKVVFQPFQPSKFLGANMSVPGRVRRLPRWVHVTDVTRCGICWDGQSLWPQRSESQQRSGTGRGWENIRVIRDVLEMVALQWVENQLNIHTGKLLR